MKKIILTCIALATGSLASAQIGQGTLMLGGSLGINSTGKTTSKITPPSGPAVSVETKGYSNWNISPTVGYFIADKTAVGLSLGVGSNFVSRETNGTAEEVVRSFNWGASIFGRQYIELGNNFYFFGQASLGYGSSSYTDKDHGTDPNTLVDGVKFTSNNLSFNIAPGLTFFPSEKWGIDFTLNRIVSYNLEKNKAVVPNNGGETSNSQGFLTIGAGLSPSIGVHYYFGN